MDEDQNDDSGVTQGVPDSIANSFYDSLTGLPESKDENTLEDTSVEDDPRLKEIQARKEQLVSMFHGAEPKQSGSFRAQVKRGEMSPSDYFTVTGRIFSGGTGDVAQKDARGNITGYKSRDGSGRALGGPSATPGLDAFHEMNPGAASGDRFSFLPPKPSALPASVPVASKAAGGNPALPSSVLPIQGPTAAAGNFAQRSFVTPHGSIGVNFSGAMNRSNTLPASLPKREFNTTV